MDRAHEQLEYRLDSEQEVDTVKGDDEVRFAAGVTQGSNAPINCLPPPPLPILGSRLGYM